MLIQAGGTNIDVESVTNTVKIYNITVDVIRNSMSVGASGNIPTPETIVSDMPCKIKWTSGRERMLFAKKTHFLDAVLRCRKSAGVTIVESDIIEYKNVQYKIEDVVDWRNLGKLLVIGLTKIS